MFYGSNVSICDVFMCRYERYYAVGDACSANEWSYINIQQRKYFIHHRHLSVFQSQGSYSWTDDSRQVRIALCHGQCSKLLVLCLKHFAKRFRRGAKNFLSFVSHCNETHFSAHINDEGKGEVGRQPPTLASPPISWPVVTWLTWCASREDVNAVVKLVLILYSFVSLSLLLHPRNISFHFSTNPI